MPCLYSICQKISQFPQTCYHALQGKTRQLTVFVCILTCHWKIMCKKTWSVILKHFLFYFLSFWATQLKLTARLSPEICFNIKSQTGCLFYIFLRDSCWHIHLIQTFPFCMLEAFLDCAELSQWGLFEPEKMLHFKMNDSIQYIHWASVNNDSMARNLWNASCSIH